MTSRTMLLRIAPSALVAAALLLAGCSASAPDETATTPPVTSAPATTPPVSTSPPVSTPPAVGTGCAATGAGVPAGAASITTIDLDGDGQADTLWVATGTDRMVGVTTATDATFTYPVDLAGPTGATAFALQPAVGGAVDVLVSDGRAADLLTVQDCALVAVTDAQGAPWVFDLGFTGYGTGVGCLDLDGDGTRDLVGLNLVPTAEQGTARTVTRTLIHVDGTVAAGGAQDQVTLAADDTTGIATASAITCGDRTLAHDGVHEPEG